MFDRNNALRQSCRLRGPQDSNNLTGSIPDDLFARLAGRGYDVSEKSFCRTTLIAGLCFLLIHQKRTPSIRAALQGRLWSLRSPGWDFNKEMQLLWALSATAQETAKALCAVPETSSHGKHSRISSQSCSQTDT